MMATVSEGHISLPHAVQRFDMSLARCIGAPQMLQKRCVASKCCHMVCYGFLPLNGWERVGFADGGQGAGVAYGDVSVGGEHDVAAVEKKPIHGINVRGLDIFAFFSGVL